MIQKNQKYDELVDRWVYGVITQGVTNFNSLLKSLPGVYPSVVLESLKRLVTSGKLPELILPPCLNDPIRVSKTRIQAILPGSQHNKLPVPHPLDYEWRFSDAAVTYLLDYFLEITEPGESIALLGTPSVLCAANVASFPRQLILLDNNAPVINLLSEDMPDKSRVTLCDVIRERLPEISASVVVIDPPWYEKHFFGFIWAAAKICNLGGKILISLPPIGTRPGIENDLDRLFDWSNQLGLSLLKIEPGILPYISPPFEINALKAENFHGLPIDWRRGDLAVFIKKQEAFVERPKIEFDSEEQWLEENVQGVRIKLKPYADPDFQDPKLLTIVPNNIFPTVSRRDPRRELVDVWTSGNRVFACEGRYVLQQILRSLASEQPTAKILAEKLTRALTKEEEAVVNEAKAQLLKIINIEREENAVFINGN